MACPITVTFTAKTDEDIYDNISVLASTGPLEIPLQATSKKALPHIEAPVVNIGNVTMGEKGTASLVVTNKVCVCGVVCGLCIVCIERMVFVLCVCVCPCVFLRVGGVCGVWCGVGVCMFVVVACG
jgi:hypothetical protein